jgi:hypothetical protein
MERGGSNPGPGDMALASLLRLHNAAMSGGLLDALTSSLTPEELARALDGFQYFGLSQVAEIVGAVASQAAEASEDELDELEGEADRRYSAAVPSDSVLTDAFEVVFDAAPARFAAP